MAGRECCYIVKQMLAYTVSHLVQPAVKGAHFLLLSSSMKMMKERQEFDGCSVCS